MSAAELEALEKKIRAGLKSFQEVGQALQKIRDGRGYLLKKYRSFEAYCEGEFHFSLRQGERLMLAASVAEQVKKVTGEAPPNEAVARVLTSVVKDPPALKKVADQLKKKGQSISTATAEKIAVVVERVTNKPKSPSAAPSSPARTSPFVATPPMWTPVFSDTCPGCRQIPAAYVRRDGRWECGDCHAHVRVNALAVEAVTCPDCKKPLAKGAAFCPNCGSVL